MWTCSPAVSAPVACFQKFPFRKCARRADDVRESLFDRIQGFLEEAEKRRRDSVDEPLEKLFAGDLPILWGLAHDTLRVDAQF